jgi:hypothetical protein
MHALLLPWRGPAVLLGAGLLLTSLLSPLAAAAPKKGIITMVWIEYQGWKNNLKLSNGDVELIVTLDVGPRVLSYRLSGGKNVFKEFTDQLGTTGEADWVGRGGHRLWIGPEDLTRTYAPDNAAVTYRVAEGNPRRVRFTPMPQTDVCVAKYGLCKEIEVELPASGSQVQVIHHITNVGREATALAPWALTVMNGGGVEVIPLPPKKPHPGPPSNARSPRDFAANQVLVLWPYFDFKDPRWTFGSRYLTLRTDTGRGPTKIGLAHQLGWAAYLNDGTLFVKRLGYQEDKHYPDHGANFETFTSKDMLEIESMGPMAKLAPGASVQHVEEWVLYGNVPSFSTEAEIDTNVTARIIKSRN